MAGAPPVVVHSSPTNGLSIVKGEMGLVVAALRSANRWTAHTYHEECQDLLLKSFHDLKEQLALIKYLEEVDSVTFLTPFLEVVRSENTTGPVTGVALSSISKILSYNLLDTSHPACSTGVETIADAVTHARFVGTDPASDEVVLMKILQVLRTLMLTPVGSLLSNEAVCEVMQSCFRICFELRLSELLRRTAEQTLMDMIHVLFVRLPQFADDNIQLGVSSSIRKALKRGLHVPDSKKARKKRGKKKLLKEKKAPEIQEEKKEPEKEADAPQADTPQADTPQAEPKECEKTEETSPDSPSTPELEGSDSTPQPSSEPGPESVQGEVVPEEGTVDALSVVDDTVSQVDSLVENDILGNVLADRGTKEEDVNTEDNFTNSRGVKFTQSEDEDGDPASPYGLACIRELFRFLSSLINPTDTHNSSEMISMGLSLLTVAMEAGGNHLSQYRSLLALCQNEIMRALFRLIQGESLGKMVTALRICNFMVENMRSHLKLQVEKYFIILMNIVVADPSKGSYEHRELALDALVHLCRLPGLIPELYLNYDCHNYCENLYENLTKALSKNAFPVSGLHITHLLSLDALLAVVNVIALQCQEDELCGNNEHSALPPTEQLVYKKEFKNKLISGSQMFNESPKAGLKYLLKEGVLKTGEKEELAYFFFHNVHLDKNQIGEFLGKKSNEPFLQEFIKQFDFVNLKIHEALRIFLETFRLPGEAQIIERIMQYFAEHWIETGGNTTNCMANTDAAFILAYAIIILNVDQHNKNKTMRKMEVADFIRNQRGLNGDGNYPEEFLEDIFKSISTNEIVMPDEHVGELRERYRWKVMLRRDEDAQYQTCGQVSLYNQTLFTLIWGPTVAALSFVFDTALDDDVTEKAINGFHKCATISAHYGLSDVFDNLIISLCKFTGLLSTGESPESMTVHFGSNVKSRLTARTMFTLAHTHGDILREGWKNILECVLQLYRANLMPTAMYQAFDFAQGHVQMAVEERAPAKQDQGLFSSIFSLLNSDTTGRGPTTQELEAQKQAKACVQECQPQKLFSDSKYLRAESLSELVQWLIQMSSGPHTHAQNSTVYNEYSSSVFIELLASVILENRDRLGPLWGPVHAHLNSLITPATQSTFLVERAIVTLLRLAVRMVGRKNDGAQVLHSTIILLLLKPNVAKRNCTSICFGIFELVRACVGCEISKENWNIIFAVLEMCGAGATPPAVTTRVLESKESETTVTEEGEEVQEEEEEEGPDDDTVHVPSANVAEPPIADITQWTMEEPKEEEKGGHLLELSTANTYFQHNPQALGKACETVSLLVRDSSIIRSDNFALCVHAVRVLAEAYSSKEREEKEDKHETGLIQLLDLMHTLHTRALSIFKPKCEEGQRVPMNDSSMNPIVGEVWVLCWCPLLQGIARVCCDTRRDVRQAGLTYLQRALLAHDLRALPAVEWEACFRQVMFPLLAVLLEPIDNEVAAVEETRMRAATLLCKAFLQHLSPLLALPGFTDLWLDILDFMDKYINSGSSDLLGEAVPENLKNMLLVMCNAGVFEEDNNYLVERNRNTELTPSPGHLWTTTWNRIDKFLPHLKQQLFPQSIVYKQPQGDTLKPSDAPPLTPPDTPPAHQEQPGKPSVAEDETPPMPTTPFQRERPVMPVSKSPSNMIEHPEILSDPSLQIAPPSLPSDLQNLMSSTPLLVAPRMPTMPMPPMPVNMPAMPAGMPAMPPAYRTITVQPMSRMLTTTPLPKSPSAPADLDKSSSEKGKGPITVEPLSSFLTK